MQVYNEALDYNTSIPYNGGVSALFTQRLSKPNVSNFFLVELTAGLHLTGWLLHSGTTYKTPVGQTVSTVRWNRDTE